MNQQQLRKLIQEEIKLVLKEGTMTKYTFSGNKNFMSRVAVPIFKKYGIDTAKLKSYDPDTGVTEITVTLDEKIAEKIGNEIENNPRAQDEYGGYMEADEDEMMEVTRDNTGALPKEISVKYLSGNKYLMYFSKFDWEPSLSELEQSLAIVYKTLKTKEDLVDLVKILAKPTVFVIDGDVCIGDIFTSRMKPAEMDDSVGLTNDEY